MGMFHFRFPLAIENKKILWWFFPLSPLAPALLQ